MGALCVCFPPSRRLGFIRAIRPSGLPVRLDGGFDRWSPVTCDVHLRRRGEAVTATLLAPWQMREGLCRDTRQHRGANSRPKLEIHNQCQPMTCRVSFEWPSLRSRPEWYCSKSARYIVQLLEGSGPGSLLSGLKEAGLGDRISAYVQPQSWGDTIEVVVSLTEVKAALLCVTWPGFPRSTQTAPCAADFC